MRALLLDARCVLLLLLLDALQPRDTLSARGGAHTHTHTHARTHARTHAPHRCAHNPKQPRNTRNPINLRQSFKEIQGFNLVVVVLFLPF
jgi:hypothetical protein